jgi:hypothetical protein
MKEQIKYYFSESFQLKAETESELTFRHNATTIVVSFSNGKNICNVYNAKGGVCFQFHSFEELTKKFNENQNHMR